MDREEIKHRIETHKTAIQISTEIIAELESQLESEKPELRHGDYCQPPSKDYTYIALYSRTDPNKYEIWGFGDYGTFLNGFVPKNDTYYTSIHRPQHF